MNKEITMTKTVSEIRAEVLRDLEEARTRYEDALDRRRGVLVERGWVTRFKGGFYNRVEIDPETRTVQAVKAVGVLGASHLTREDAETIARVTRNGAGQTCEAVPYVEALRDELAVVEKLIEQYSEKEGAAA